MTNDCVANVYALNPVFSSYLAMSCAVHSINVSINWLEGVVV